MTNIYRMKKNYNWAKATLVMGCMLSLGWLATPVMALDRDVRLMDEDTTIMVVAEVQPEFNGNLNQWIGENVQYPEEAYANQIDGRVFVTFVIEKDGAVTHARVVRSAHPLLDAEALRVIAGMPKWKPAMSGGKAVRFEKTLPHVHIPCHYRGSQPPQTKHTTHNKRCLSPIVVFLHTMFICH